MNYMPCKHQYREVSIEWEAKTGKLWQKLECDKCGHVSMGWTKPETPVKKIRRIAEDDWGET